MSTHRRWFGDARLTTSTASPVAAVAPVWSMMAIGTAGATYSDASASPHGRYHQLDGGRLAGRTTFAHVRAFELAANSLCQRLGNLRATRPCSRGQNRAMRSRQSTTLQAEPIGWLRPGRAGGAEPGAAKPEHSKMCAMSNSPPAS